MQNGRIVRRLREAMQVALILLLAEIVVWLLSIAVRDEELRRQTNPDFEEER